VPYYLAPPVATAYVDAEAGVEMRVAPEPLAAAAVVVADQPAPAGAPPVAKAVAVDP
jgi:hypothetical protein